MSSNSIGLSEDPKFEDLNCGKLNFLQSISSKDLKENLKAAHRVIVNASGDENQLAGNNEAGMKCNQEVNNRVNRCITEMNPYAAGANLGIMNASEAIRTELNLLTEHVNLLRDISNTHGKDMHELLLKQQSEQVRALEEKITAIKDKLRTVQEKIGVLEKQLGPTAKNKQELEKAAQLIENFTKAIEQHKTVINTLQNKYKQVMIAFQFIKEVEVAFQNNDFFEGIAFKDLNLANILPNIEDNEVLGAIINTREDKKNYIAFQNKMKMLLHIATNIELLENASGKELDFSSGGADESISNARKGYEALYQIREGITLRGNDNKDNKFIKYLAGNLKEERTVQMDALQKILKKSRYKDPKTEAALEDAIILQVTLAEISYLPDEVRAARLREVKEEWAEEKARYSKDKPLSSWHISCPYRGAQAKYKSVLEKAQASAIKAATVTQRKNSDEYEFTPDKREETLNAVHSQSVVADALKELNRVSLLKYKIKALQQADEISAARKAILKHSVPQDQLRNNSEFNTTDIIAIAKDVIVKEMKEAQTNYNEAKGQLTQAQNKLKRISSSGSTTSTKHATQKEKVEGLKAKVKSLEKIYNQAYYELSIKLEYGHEVYGNDPLLRPVFPAESGLFNEYDQMAIIQPELRKPLEALLSKQRLHEVNDAAFVTVVQALHNQVKVDLEQDSENFTPLLRTVNRLIDTSNNTCQKDLDNRYDQIKKILPLPDNVDTSTFQAIKEAFTTQLNSQNKQFSEDLVKNGLEGHLAKLQELKEEFSARQTEKGTVMEQLADATRLTDQNADNQKASEKAIIHALAPEYNAIDVNVKSLTLQKNNLEASLEDGAADPVASNRHEVAVRKLYIARLSDLIIHTNRIMENKSLINQSFDTINANLEKLGEYCNRQLADGLTSGIAPKLINIRALLESDLRVIIQALRSDGSPMYTKVINNYDNLIHVTEQLQYAELRRRNIAADECDKNSKEKEQMLAVSILVHERVQDRLDENKNFADRKIQVCKADLDRITDLERVGNALGHPVSKEDAVLLATGGYRDLLTLYPQYKKTAVLNEINHQEQEKQLIKKIEAARDQKESEAFTGAIDERIKQRVHLAVAQNIAQSLPVDNTNPAETIQRMLLLKKEPATIKELQDMYTPKTEEWLEQMGLTESFHTAATHFAILKSTDKQLTDSAKETFRQSTNTNKFAAPVNPAQNTFLWALQEALLQDIAWNVEETVEHYVTTELLSKLQLNNSGVGFQEPSAALKDDHISLFAFLRMHNVDISTANLVEDRINESRANMADLDLDAADEQTIQDIADMEKLDIIDETAKGIAYMQQYVLSLALKYFYNSADRHKIERHIIAANKAIQSNDSVAYKKVQAEFINPLKGRLAELLKNSFEQVGNDALIAGIVQEVLHTGFGLHRLPEESTPV